MNLNPQERTFVAKRERYVRSWPLAGTSLFILLAGLAAWLLWKTPYLLNPWTVLDSLRSNSISESTLKLMAVMLPLVVLTGFVSLTCMLLLFFAAFSNEKKHIAIIRRITSDEDARMDSGKTD